MAGSRRKVCASLEVPVVDLRSPHSSDEETQGLVEADSRKGNEKHLVCPQERATISSSPLLDARNGDDPLGFSFSIRKLGFVVAFFLVASHLLLAWQCTVACAKRDISSESLLSKWNVTTNNHSSDLMVTTKPWKMKTALGYLHPGEQVELILNRSDSDYYQLLRPMLGFVPKKSEANKDYFKPVEADSSLQTVESSICPLIYEGWWPKGTSRRLYLYAPTTLVVAQQLWNAMQVFHLFLLLVLVAYECSQVSTDEPISWMQTQRKVFVCLPCIATVCLLPFSVYLISPGGHIFACVTFVSTLMAIFLTPLSDWRVSIGEAREEDAAVEFSERIPQYAVTCEETLAFLCNLGSSLYNYAGSIWTWPHWKRHFTEIDQHFGWPTTGDCSVEEDFTMGLSAVRVPLFVSRATGSRTGAQVFLVVWSVLPFLYVSYFGCMFVLARRSPGVLLQRGLCLFGMCHFLFFTDVVAYRYGRGYRNPHEDIVHWFEKWAWRIAILLPVYQNCTNGHWKDGHKRCPVLGKALRRALICWGVYFLLFQVIQSDGFKFSQFLFGKRQRGLLAILGLSKVPHLNWLAFPYPMALVTMFLMYGLLRVTGFTLFWICVHRKDPGHGLQRDESQEEEEDERLQKGLLTANTSFLDGEDDDHDDGEMLALAEL